MERGGSEGGDEVFRAFAGAHGNRKFHPGSDDDDGQGEEEADPGSLVAAAAAADAGWRPLRRVEMSDWEVRGDSLPLVRLREAGWHYEAKGVFVRDTVTDDSSDGSDASDW